MTRLADLIKAKEHFATLNGEIYDGVKSTIKKEIAKIKKHKTPKKRKGKE